MFLGDLNDPAGAQQATDNHAGTQQATPAIDREELEWVLERTAWYVDKDYGAAYCVPTAVKCLDVLRDAARAHLATLPKPEPARWHVTASIHRPGGTTAAPPYVTESHEVALAYARGYVNQGYTNVNIRWVRS